MKLKEAKQRVYDWLDSQGTGFIEDERVETAFEKLLAPAKWKSLKKFPLTPDMDGQLAWICRVTDPAKDTLKNIIMPNYSLIQTVQGMVMFTGSLTQCATHYQLVGFCPMPPKLKE